MVIFALNNFKMVDVWFLKVYIKFMPSGQLAFHPAGQAYTATVGIDSYVVVKSIPGTISSTPTMQFIALYMGTSAVRSLGGSDRLDAAINLCQTDFNSLAT